MIDWRTLQPDALEAQFNPRVAVGNSRAEAYLEDFAARSRDARKRLGGTFDIRFGEGSKCTFDLFRPAGPAPHPALVFIHGGYWRALDKHDHHFVAEAPVRAGFAVLVVNYDLCPEVTLDDIVAEMRTFMAFLGREASALGLGTDAIALAGHSAGAHLAAMLLHDAGAPEALPVAWAGLSSGIYEPEAVLAISVNADVRLTADMAERNDALRRPPQGRPRIEVTVGALEPAAWIGQSEAYALEARRAGHVVDYAAVPQTDHFTILHRPIVPPFRGLGAGG